ncbi:CesT family type III secretion system chaperone [Erwinia mallotivora]|uniref:CesT family type III secretion system chaperone n=1 Tax=Erwinia mallotivora TaxID=69222 RepID=UPI0021C02C72|nr:CesT family type III secretion system chaperone [Erwinia mallotivora]
MKNAFDNLVEGLVKDFGMTSFPEKSHEDEVYCFELENKSVIKIYQDNARWVYFLVEFGNLTALKSETLIEFLMLNKFSFRKPFLTLGVNSDKTMMLHTRVPLMEVDSVQMRSIFEDLIIIVNNLKIKFNIQ